MRSLLGFSLVCLFLCLLLLSACSPIGKDDEMFERDVRNDFCGYGINAMYCKCAFHGEFCDEVNMSKKEAKAKVDSEYKVWYAQEFDAFKAYCLERGGSMDEKYHACLLPAVN